MTMQQIAARGGTLLALLSALIPAQPAEASTFRRASLEELAARSSIVALGEVVDAVSYWSSDHTFILTDVTFAPAELIKGESSGHLTLTLMGGQVGELTTLILGGAELIPGRSYVVFLGHEDLPGAPQALTVSDHCQGVFDLVAESGVLKVVSQAHRQPLVPDRQGKTEAPGGAEGLSLDALVRGVQQSTEPRNSGQGGVR